MKKPLTLGFALLVAFSTTVAVAQSQFAGKWRTKVNAEGKSTITLNIAESAGRINGTVVLLDSHGELEMAIVNASPSGATLEFETKERGSSWFWRLTLKGKMEGLLHGSIGEMLIEERVKKHRGST